MAETKAKPLSKVEEKALLDTMTLEEKVEYHYQHGQGSIQDIARVYRMSVEEVLHIIGQDEMTSVTTQGDLIDADEAGNAPLNHGENQRARFDLS